MATTTRRPTRSPSTDRRPAGRSRTRILTRDDFLLRTDGDRLDRDCLDLAAIGLVLLIKLRRLKADQTVLLGSGEARDLVAESAESRRVLDGLAEEAKLANAAVDNRFDSIEVALDRSLSGFSLVRYDAYDEASGRQSVSIALVDSSGSGVVLSSLVRRESARMYARLVGEGSDESALSPEEVEAVKAARQRTAQR